MTIPIDINEYADEAVEPIIQEGEIEALTDAQLDTLSETYGVWMEYFPKLSAQFGDTLDLGAITFSLFYDEKPLRYIVPHNPASKDLGSPLICQIKDEQLMFQYRKGNNVQGEFGESFSLRMGNSWWLINLVSAEGNLSDVSVTHIKCFPESFWESLPA